LTGRELALLRVILRQDMRADVRAAVAEPNYVDANDVAPLETALGRCPSIEDLNDVMTDEANPPFRRFNASRALAYLGDRRCMKRLWDIAGGDLVLSASSFEQSKAALCLLYLGYDFPAHFLFTRLPNPLYPELNLLLDPPADLNPPNPLYSVRYDAPDPPYSKEQIEAVVLARLGPYELEIRGPLTTLDVEYRELQRDMEQQAAFERVSPWISVECWEEWQSFKAQMRKGDLLYYFITDEISWSLLGGREGYVLVREGQVVHLLVTALN
jgi:hypothetical protein